MTTGDNHLSSRKKIVFRLLSFLLIILFFVLIEVILRIFSYGTDMHLFVKHDSESMENYLMINPRVGEKYFSRFEATSSANDVFLAKKPEGCFRVFLLGSSTVFGYPYDHNLMASRILHQRLQDAYPEKIVEVVNTSITAINSVTLKDYINQVLDYEPDAVLLYAGHNEFYGAFGPGSNEAMSKNPFLLSVHFKLINLRMYQFMRSAIQKFSQGQGRTAEASGEKGPLMKRIVKDEDIIYQGEKYQLGLEQYTRNMSYILQKASVHDVPVFVSDLVSNIRDLHPFGDMGTADQSARQTYKDALDLLSDGDTLAAKTLFCRARDLDPVRFRASEDINQIIYTLSEEYNAILVPVKERFSSVSPGAMIGNNLLTEHVHPNIDGQFLLADAFYSSIVASGLLSGVSASISAPGSEYYRFNWDYTPLDSLIGVYKIEQLKSYWPFTSLASDITFRDTFQAENLLDSMAFTILTDPGASIQSLHGQLADLYELRGEYDLALREYKALIRSNPYHSPYYNMAATCKLSQNDLHAAEKYLRNSLKYRTNILAFTLLGEIESTKHNYQGAVEFFEHAIEMAGANSDEKESTPIIIDIQRKLTSVQNRRNHPATSANFEYLNFIPDDIEAVYRRALSITQTNGDSALHYFMLCLEINDCPLVNFRIGDLLYMKRDISAMQYYEKAYDGLAMYPDFLVRYCVSCIYNQERAKALAIFKELTEISPQHPDLPNLKSAL